MVFPRVAVIGAGVTGNRVVSHLLNLGISDLAVADRNRYKAQQLAATYRSNQNSIKHIELDDLGKCTLVVVACAGPHEPFLSQLIRTGIHVVSMSDDLRDAVQLTQLDVLAQKNNTMLVIGAAASPGLTGLLVSHTARFFDEIDEAHVALHGTGGPNCAHQHHGALSRQSLGWHDGDWLRRPAGSGRELCWFPEPVGAYDCYRAEMSDPYLLRFAFPQLHRITARMSATRRDRLTARLPMMSPPHAEGGIGAVRVEVRGWKDRSRKVMVVGVAERVAQIAALVAGSTAFHLVSEPAERHGVLILGSNRFPNIPVLSHILRSGINMNEFVGKP
jgi:hypothetical protein